MNDPNLYWPQDPMLEAQMREIHSGLKDALIAAERAHDRVEAKNLLDRLIAFEQRTGIS